MSLECQRHSRNNAKLNELIHARSLTPIDAVLA
jgi:hypothetical protein